MVVPNPVSCERGIKTVSLNAANNHVTPALSSRLKSRTVL